MFVKYNFTVVPGKHSFPTVAYNGNHSFWILCLLIYYRFFPIWMCHFDSVISLAWVLSQKIKLWSSYEMFCSCFLISHFEYNIVLYSLVLGIILCLTKLFSLFSVGMS